MPWEVKVISEDKQVAPIEIAFAETISDIDRYITWALESLNRACAAKDESRESADRSRAKEVIRRLGLCGVKVKLEEVPGVESDSKS